MSGYFLPCLHNWTSPARASVLLLCLFTLPGTTAPLWGLQVGGKDSDPQTTGSNRILGATACESEGPADHNDTSLGISGAPRVPKKPPESANLSSFQNPAREDRAGHRAPRTLGGGPANDEACDDY